MKYRIVKKCLSVGLSLAITLVSFLLSVQPVWAASVTDSYADTSKINTGASSNYKVTGGQLRLAYNDNKGTGAEGDLTVTGTTYADDVKSAVSSQSNATSTTVNVSSTTGFATGQEILIIQMISTGAGNYEFQTVSSVGSGVLNLAAALTNTYYTGAQVIRVHNWNNVTVQSGGTLTASAWNGTTGAVVVFRAAGAVNVQSGGKILADALGFTAGGGGAGGTGGAAGSYANGGGGGCSGAGACAICSGQNGANAPNGGGGSGGPAGSGGCNTAGSGGTGGSGSAGNAGGTGSAGSGSGGGSAGGGAGANSAVASSGNNFSSLLPGGGGGGGAGGAGGSGSGGGGAGGGGGGSETNPGTNGNSSASGTNGSAGGAGGAAGAGGGIISIFADSLSVSGTVSALGGGGTGGSAGTNGVTAGSGGNGGSGADGGTTAGGGGGGGGKGGSASSGGGGGGGGAGGTISITTETATLGTSLITATGGSNGSGAAAGASGGGGGSPGGGAPAGGSSGAGGATGAAGSAGAAGGAGGTGKIVVKSVSNSGSTDPTFTSYTTPFYTSGTVQSTNLLTGVSVVSQITSFVYNLSSLPANTTATVQFSQNASSWYNSAGTLGGTNSLSTGLNNTIDLTALDWQGANLYYKLAFTSDGSGSPYMDDVTVNYNSNARPGAPTISAPLNGATSVSFKPVITLAATDAESNSLQYKIQLATDTGFTQNLQTFDETSSQTGWSGQDAQLGAAYASGTTATYTVQTALNENTTYYIRGYAKDPSAYSGSGLWGVASSTVSFTTLVLSPPTNCIVVGTGATTAHVTWNDNTAIEDNYLLERKVDGGAFSLLQTLNAGVVSADDTTVTTGTYVFRVRAISNGAYSAYCTTNSIIFPLQRVQIQSIQLQNVQVR